MAFGGWKGEQLVVIGDGMNGLDSGKLVSNVTRVRDKRTRYANYRIAVGLVVAISLSTLFCSKGIVSYPELTLLCKLLVGKMHISVVPHCFPFSYKHKKSTSLPPHNNMLIATTRWIKGMWLL